MKKKVAGLAPSTTLFPGEDLYPQADKEIAALPAFHQEIAQIPSCPPIQGTVAAIQNASAKQTKWVKGEGCPPCFPYQKKESKMLIEYRDHEREEPFSDEAIASLWDQMRKGGDAEIDVMLYAFAQLMSPTEPDGRTWFHAGQYLNERGVQKIHKKTATARVRDAGHRQEDIRDVARRLSYLENIWIRMTLKIDEAAMGKKKRGKKTYVAKGRLLMVEWAVAQREVWAGSTNEMEIAWLIRPGDWLKVFLESPNRQVAYFLQKSIQYAPHKEMWEKRLSRYITFHGQMNARGMGCTLKRNLAGIFSELSFEFNEHDPQRTVERFEKAMNRIAEDGFMQEWKDEEGKVQPAWGYSEDVELPARGWIPQWLAQDIFITIAPAKPLVSGPESPIAAEST